MQTLHRDNYTVDEWDDICKRFNVPNICLTIDIDEDDDYFVQADVNLDDFEDYMYNNEYDDDFDDMTDDEDCKWVE
jgi:hypothetical protein